MRNDRIEKLETFICEHQSVSLVELCAEFHVSMNTIRRDLDEILAKGRIEKVYGGVRAVTQTSFLAFDERKDSCIEQKKAIGMVAAQQVEDGDSIFVDSGTTTLQLIPFLSGKQDVTLVTYSVSALCSASQIRGLRVICLPGMLNRATNSLIAMDSAVALDAFNITKAFMGAAGFSVSAGATISVPIEHDIKRKAVERSLHVYALADSAKFGKTSLITYAPLSEFDALITDKRPDPDFCENLSVANVQIIHASMDK